MSYRVAEVELLMVPGPAVADPDHWLARWTRQLKTARWVTEPGAEAPTVERLAAAIAEAVAAARLPVVLIAHGPGVTAVARAAHRLAPGRVAGAFLVAPAGPELAAAGRAMVADDPLPFPSVLVASRSDPETSYEQAADLALAWGAALADAGNSGRLDARSGHGPWPDGLMRLGMFLKTL